MKKTQKNNKLKMFKDFIFKNKAFRQFILILIGLLSVFYYFLETGAFNGIINYFIITNIAIVVPILNFFGYSVKNAGLSIFYNNYQFQIGLGCEGFEPMFQFIAVSLAFPNKFLNKIIIISIGISLIFLMNIFRLIVLFILFASNSSYLDLFHSEIFPILIALLEFGMWVKMVKVSLKKNS